MIFFFSNNNKTKHILEIMVL